MPLCSLEEALDDLKAGKFVIVVDHEDRENEGDLVMPAELVTSDTVNFAITEARGLLCMPVTGERLDELNIPLMIPEDPHSTDQTAFTVSVDYNKGTTTGISAQDRAATVRAVIDPNAQSNDFSRPGHLFPLRYNPGGVLARAGHTEAIIDLCRMMGMALAGIVCEIMNKDGTMSRIPELEKFAKRHSLKILSIVELIIHRRREKLVERVTGTTTVHIG